MPITDDAARADGHLLLDAAGTTLARFVEGERDGHRLADLVERMPGVPLDAFVAQITADLPGWKVAGDVALGRALVAAGAEPSRHDHEAELEAILDGRVAGPRLECSRLASAERLYVQLGFERILSSLGVIVPG